ncbi:MAG: patatin-like phospholipase family protein [Prevotella sp.]|nr:patatin-like phospholipase family protein [Prevotella sp.]
MAKIAISLSGGGYRAASYHLGALSYLNHLKTADETPLLDHISAVSTISGGTLTGLWFVLGKCRGVDNRENLKALYDKLMEGDVIGRASTDFLNGDNTNNSLIREMAKIYDEDLFGGATFGELMEKIDEISIDDFSANATEFTRALPFRFQTGKKITTARGGTSQGVIGNSSYKIPKSVASQIRLSEIFAASSCFPGGFEPLFFPDDFQLSKDEANADYLKNTETLALMDGGIVDNQGVEPINLIRKRRGIDLFIISDAGRGGNTAYEYKETDALSHLSIHRINVTLNVVILCFAQFLLWVPKGFWFGFFFGLTLILLAIRMASALASRRMIKKYAKQVPFRFDWKGLLHINFAKYINLFLSRATSMWALTDKVYMKHIRSLNYATIYEDDRWQNRRIMNALYELCPEQNWSKHLADDEKPLMEPSDAIYENSKNAVGMETTLWWSDEDRKQRRPEALFSTGQYNICWNLLEYIYRLRRDNTNTTEAHRTILQLEKQLEEDWARFKENPQWLLSELAE